MLPFLLVLAVTSAMSAEPPSILITRQLAEAEHLAVGDIVALSSDPAGKEPRSFRIAGIY